MRRISIVLALPLLAAACGGGETGSIAEPDRREAAPNSDIPAVVVRDTAGGEFDLASLVPADKPILIWFWAPH